MNVFNRIEKAVAEIPHGWTSIAKAHALACSIITLRPKYSLEIGVYAGKGLVAMGLAHQECGVGMAIGVDPYSPKASAEGQVNPSDKDFWGKLDHEMIMRVAQEALVANGVQNCARIERFTSDAFSPPDGIGVLRIDGNHGDQVLSDIERYCPKVSVGGIVFLDDIGWAGGSVQRAAARLVASRWVLLYRIDDGIALQKIR